MKLRRMLSCMMALLLVCSLPVSALAAEYDLAQGSVTVNATESGQTVTHGFNAAVQDSAPVITQSNSSTPTTNTVTIKAEGNATANVTIQDVNIAKTDPSDGSGKAAVTIDVADNASANVTLDGVNIDVSGTGSIEGGIVPGEAAVQITGNGNVVIELDNTNTVKSGDTHAGVEKNNGGKLTITDGNETPGSLNATGGFAGAGIGGGWNGSVSNITIEGSAEVTANGGNGGSGIGGGDFGTGSHITITGSAEVTAQGGQSGSGIGGGHKNSGSHITIAGSAEVTAQGGKGGSGIGGGRESTGSSDITVSEDSQVKAQGGEKFVLSNVYYYGAGAAIGEGGEYKYKSEADPGDDVNPNTGDLNEGWIATYTPGKNMQSNTPDSLTYKDANETVTTANQNITIEAAAPATSDTHGHEAGFKVGDKLVAVTTHYYDNYVSNDDATCTHNGTETGECTVPGCKAKLERTIPGTMLDHEYGDYIPDANNLATCTKAGTKTAKCKNCPATDTVPDPIKDHSMGEYYTETPATCQAEGVERRDCANCTYSETRPLKKVDHSYGDFSSDNNATCTSDGTKTRKCIWCGLKDTVTDPGTMKEHSFTNYISNNDATYDADGTKTAKCDHCDATHTIPDPGSRLVREEADQTAQPLYRVTGQDGKALACKTEQSSGVLTITVDADFASLTGSFSGMKTLKAQGVDTIVFVTKGASSSFTLADLLAQGSTGDSYTLTHDGKTVTFTLGTGADISKILK